MSEDRKLVVVTGTSGGLGTAIVETLVLGGYQVVGVARREPTGEFTETSEGQYRHICWDLGDIDSLKPLSDLIGRDFGKPYALVNNAALGSDGLLPTMHNRDIERVIRVNLTSPIVLTKFLIRPMLQKRMGRIISISSIVARTGYRGLAAYGATKAGIEGFTRSLARDVGPRGVTVNAVAAGFLDTNMTAGLGDENLRRIMGRSALKRFATTSEVAASIGYLLSPEAAGVTGSVLTVDAGSTA